MIDEQEEIVKRVYDFVEGRTDTLSYEDSLKWLEQMAIEAPTQEELGKQETKYEND
jgi:hypothetical protein